jgi:hypothetical protein
VAEVEQLQSSRPVTVSDVASALKDHLLAEPDIDLEDEAPLIAALFDVPAIDAPIANVDDWPSRARSLCGVLVKSPQFLLRGAPQLTQASLPVIVVGPSSYREECERLGALVVDPATATLRCEDASLEVVPLSP